MWALMQKEIKNLICIGNSDTLKWKVKALDCDSEDTNLISGSSTYVILQEIFHMRIIPPRRTAGEISVCLRSHLAG